MDKELDLYQIENVKKIEFLTLKDLSLLFDTLKPKGPVIDYGATKQGGQVRFYPCKKGVGGKKRFTSVLGLPSIKL